MLNLLKIKHTLRVRSRSWMWSRLYSFFLAVKGYSNIWGIDINSNRNFRVRKNACNKIFKIVLGSKKIEFQTMMEKKSNLKVILLILSIRNK